VLRRTRHPEAELEVGEDAVQLLREPKRAGDVLALDRARRLQQDEVVLAESELRARLGAVAGRRIEIEVVVDRRRVVVPARVELAATAAIGRRVQRVDLPGREL